MSSKVVTLTVELICVMYIVMYNKLHCCIKELSVCESYVAVTVGSAAASDITDHMTCECQWCVIFALEPSVATDQLVSVVVQ